MYGGGGIVPDVFVPVDTVAVTGFLVNCNRKGLQIKYASELLDSYSAAIKQAATMEKFDRFISTVDLERGFLSFAQKNGEVPAAGEWERSREFMMTQIRALVARYTPMGDDAFYPIYYKTDVLIEKAVRNEPLDSGRN